MSAALLFDTTIALLLVAVALWTVLARSAFSSIMALIGFGGLLVIAWMRLEAPDVALTEGAIATGLGAFLLLSAQGRLEATGADHQPVTRGVRMVSALLATGLGALLVVALLSLPAAPPTLAAHAHAQLDRVGLGNAVNAVLLGYRALDTLLEKVVIFLALVGVWSLARDHAWTGRPRLVARDPAELGPARLMARIAPPIGVLLAAHLLWNGADEPGGAFASAAVLAAMWLLVVVGGVSALPATGARSMRVAVIAGPLFFISMALAGFPMAGAFLALPEAWSKPIIVVIEVGLVVSVAATLVLMVAGPPQETEASP